MIPYAKALHLRRTPEGDPGMPFMVWVLCPHCANVHSVGFNQRQVVRGESWPCPANLAARYRLGRRPALKQAAA